MARVRLVSRWSARRPWAWYLVVALIVVIAGAGASPHSGLAGTNPIVLENQQPGTTSWQFTDYNKSANHEIEGYASLTSVNKGGQIALMVSLSTSAQYNMDFYRMGWYPTGTNPNGTSCAPSCGGRLMLHVGPLNGAEAGQLSDGHVVHGSQLRDDRVQLDAQLHADRADDLDAWRLPRQAHAPRQYPAAELHDVRRERRLEPRAGALLARYEYLAGLQLLGRDPGTTTSASTSTDGSTTSRRGSSATPAPTRSPSIGRTWIRARPTAPETSSSGTSPWSGGWSRRAMT